MVKKAQITAFIIIGLIILIIAGFGIYYFTSSKDISQEPFVEEVPLWTQPIKDYVESCLHQVAIEAVIKLGEHGGYIDINDPELSTREFNINSDPTESDTVSLSLDSDPIPYWWYLETENDCVDCLMDSQQPSLIEMEDQITTYVGNNLDNCLNKFSPFLIQDFTITQGDSVINSFIATNNIVVNLELPIEISKDESTVEISKFSTIVNVDLEQLFELGTEISLFLLNEQALEEITMDMVNFFAGTELNQLPPLTAIDHDFATTTWQLDLVQKDIQDLLTNYIPAVQIDKTLDVERIISDTEVEQGFFDKLYMFPLEKEYPINVNFYYLDFPSYLDITPRSGSLLKPRTDVQEFPLGILPPSRTNFYEFYYDISYPVIIELRDPAALNNKGYSLFFAYEVNIRDNIDLLKWHLGSGTIGTWDLGAVSLYDNGVQRSVKKLFCKDLQKLSGDIKINVNDKKGPIQNAHISYNCGNYKSCSFSPTNEEGISIDTYPICMGGFLKIEKEGFVPIKVPLDTQIGKEENINVVLQPITEINVNIKKYVMTDPNTIDLSPKELDDKDKIVITISKVVQTASDVEYTQFYSYPNTKDLPIKLIPGTYEVSATYVREESFTIKKGCKVICESYSGGLFGHGCDGYKSIPENDEEITSSLKGGVNLNQESTFWTITEADLDNNKNIEFYILQTPQPNCIDEATNKDDECCVDLEGNLDPCCIDPSEDTMDDGCPHEPNRQCIGLNEISKTQQYSNQHKNNLLPTFS